MQGFSAMAELPLGVLPRFQPGYTPIVTERFATHGWTASDTDPTPGQHIRGRLEPMTITRNLPVGGEQLMGGVVRQSAGTISLENSDGALDILAETRGVEGRPIRLKVASGRRGTPAIADMSPSWEGIVERWAFLGDKVEIYTQDYLSALDRPVSSTVYSGAGGLSGSAGLEGKSKPVGFGRVRNAEPELIDPDLLVYQYHDGFSRGLTAVRDMGSPLNVVRDVSTYEDLVQATVNAGDVVSCRFLGVFRLGDYANGTITCDFFGHGEDPALAVGVWDDGLLWDDGLPWDEGNYPVYSETAAGIIKHLVTDRAGIPLASVDEGQFADAERAWPYPVHAYLPAGAGETSVMEVASRLAEAAGLIISVNRGGLVYAKRLGLPSPGITITDEDIISISRIEPPFGRPVYRAAIPFDQNQTVQASGDLVRPDDQFNSAESLKPWQTAYAGTAEAGSTRTQERVLNSRSVMPESAVYATEEGAAARARDIIKTHGPNRAVFQVVCVRRGWKLDLGDSVTLFHSTRYGLEGGRPVTVIAITDNGPARQVTLDLLG